MRNRFYGWHEGEMAAALFMVGVIAIIGFTLIVVEEFL